MPGCETCTHFIGGDPLACPDICYTCGILQKNYEPKKVYITTGRTTGKTLLQEEMVARMGKEDGFTSVFKTYREADEALAQKYGKRKDYNKMVNYKNIVVCIDGNYYRPSSGDCSVRVGEYPRYDLRVELDPLYMVKEVSGSSKIKDVIFNPPATIVFWIDGSKTVVKAEGEEFDPEKGLAMAIAKKALGNKGNYFNVIKKYADEYRVNNLIYEESKATIVFDGELNPFKKLAETISGPWSFICKKPGDDECQTK